MTVQQFRKRPVVVSAIQPAVHRDPEITAEVLDTLHSTWVGVKTGQWIVKGVKGEFYPIDEAVPAETYEPVNADA